MSNLSSRLAFVGVACTVVLASAGNSTSNSSGSDNSSTVVDILGQSGKFTVYDKKRGKSNGITVTMDALRELDADGEEVGASGSTKHSINTFAAQSFTIDPAEDVLLGDVPAVKITFSSPISTIGKIKVDTYVIGKSGQVGPPDETWKVNPGDLKWNIELSDWTWCGCKKGQKDETGAFIDLDISVKGLSDINMKGNSSKSLALGDNMSLELSNQLKADGAWIKMPEGFPKITMKGSSTTFVFRFPKFTRSSLYDPAITGVNPDTAEAEEDEEPTTEGGEQGLTAGVTGITSGATRMGIEARFVALATAMSLFQFTSKLQIA